MKDKIRLVLINIALTVIFIASINFLSSAVLFANEEIRMLFVKGNTEELYDNGPGRYANLYVLPNYDNNREFMKVYFKEDGQFNSSYEPYIAWTSQPFQGKTITIDNNGDRLHENVLVDKSNKSVYFFGGSTMWGLGASDNSTIPALFNSISGMPSYNKGERGFNSRQSLARLVNILARGEEIDIAIFYDGVNDVNYSCRADIGVGEHGKRHFLGDEWVKN